MSSQILQQIQKSAHWDQQVALLHSLQISQQTAQSLCSQKSITTIKGLLSNPRSKVVVSTCVFLIQMCEKYGASLGPFFIGLMGTQVMFKLLNSANKVIFMETHELFKAVVVNCPQSKYYGILMSEINSKNCQVRQCISSYLVVLADNVEPPSNCLLAIKNYRSDPNKTVRQNISKLEQIMSKKGTTQNHKKVKQNKQNQPSIAIHKKQKLPQIENSQLIIESFLKSSSASQSQCYSQLGIEIDLEQNIQFLIQKIYSDETWNMKIFAIEELANIFTQEALEDKNWLKIFGVFVDLLDQRRSKINVIMCGLARKSLVQEQDMTKKYLENNFATFVEKAGKNEETGAELISLAVDLDSQRYILQLAQCSMDVKALKQKATLLDLLVSKLCAYSMPASKVPVIMKIVCKHIEKHHSNKEINLPCLAILSHFKVAHSSQFLSCLLCQDKSILAKIIEIAQKIDPHLREAIINYIHSLKGERKERESVSESSIVKKSQLEILLSQIVDDEEGSVTKLVEYVFERKDQVSVREFYEIIKLTEKVASKDSLLELQLLLEQVGKSQNEHFVEALLQAVASCNGNTIESEYIVSYLRKVNSIFMAFPWLMHPRHAQKLTSIYRYSKCPKTRLLCIKTLSLFPGELTSAFINSKQKKLIQSQQKYQNQSLCPPL